MSIKKSLAWMGIAQLVSFALQLASTVIVARYLTAHETGIYAAALTLVGVLSLVQTMGLPAVIIRETHLNDDVKTTAFTINAFICIALALTIYAVSHGAELMLGDPGVGRALRGLSPTPLFAIFSFLPAAMLEREGNFKTIALVGTVAAIVSTGVVIVGAVMGASYMTVVYGQWANVAATTLGMNIAGRHHAALRHGLSTWRKVASFTLQIFTVTGISNLATRMSDILLGSFAGLSALGFYNRASAINGLLWTNIHLFIGRVMLVDFAELHRSGISLRERYLATVSMITALLWPLFLGIAVLSGPLVHVLLGERWMRAATPLTFLAIASIVSVAITMTWELFAATGRMHVQMRVELVRSAVALAAFAVGAAISLEAAAFTRVLDAIFANLLYRRQLNRMTDTATADFISIYATGSALALVAAGPSIVVMAIHGWSHRTPLELLLPAVAGGIALWVAALFLLRHPLWREAAAPLLQRMGRRKFKP